MTKHPLLVSEDMVRKESQDQLFRAVLISITDYEATVQRDGSLVTEGPYPVLDGVELLVGDEVIVSRIGFSYVVLGRLLRSGMSARTEIQVAGAEISTQKTTTSAALENIAGLSCSVTTTRDCKLVALMSFDCDTASGGAPSTLAVALNLHSMDHQEHQQYLAGTNDRTIGAVVHVHPTVEPAGTYTLQGRFRRVSGAATPAIESAAIVLMAVPAV